MDVSQLRNLLAGPAFKPKVEDIPTPQILRDVRTEEFPDGVPDGILRLVSWSAEERRVVYASFRDETPMVNTWLLIATALRLRDSGGPDGKGTPVFSPVDAQVMPEQDPALTDALSSLVKPFLGLGPVQPLVEAAKNGSGAAQNQEATPSSTSGTASPSDSDSPPSENANPPSETATS